MARRNFARGEPPPSHSWEWAGVAKPPSVTGKTAARPAARGTPNARPAGDPPVAVFAMSETIVLKKKRSWIGYAAAGVVGFFLGYKSGAY